MTSLLSDFLDKVEFNSYNDFKKNFKLNVPENFNFAYDVVDKYAEIDPDKKALIWTDDNERRVFTFEDMKKLSNQVANFLTKQGIKKGDTVMLTLKNRYEFWITMMGLHKIGAIVIPATHMLKLHDIKYRLSKADVKAVITVEEDQLIPDYEEAEKELGINLLKLVVKRDIDGWINYNEAISKESEVFERPSGDKGTTSNDDLLIFFTSGTSGEPKMVVHDHTYPLGHIVTAKYWHDVVEDGIHHTSADTGWGKAVWGNLYGQWIAGSATFVYDYDRFNGLKLIEKVIENNVTTFCAPPTIYRFIIKEDVEGYDFSNIRHFTTAGEPLPAEVSKRFYDLTGKRIREGFGQTESTLMLATFVWLEPKLESVGKPNPAYGIKLLDNNDNEVDIGDEGEICVDVSNGAPAGLFKGYLNDEEKTNSVWHDGFYHCGDNVWMDEDGYVHFIGRKDDIIKSSGYRIGPYEVESAVLSHDAVFECAITGYPDEIRGQIVKATIVLQKGYEPSDELIKDIQNHVKKATAPYKYPRMIEFVDEIPKTISSKIQRAAIRKMDE